MGGIAGQNFAQKLLEFVDTCARNDHGIATAMSFLCDSKKPTAIVFPEFNEEVLALNLELARLKYGIHLVLQSWENRILKRRMCRRTTQIFG